MNDRRFGIMTKGWATAQKEALGKQIGEVMKSESDLKPSQEDVLARMRARHKQLVQVASKAAIGDNR